MNQRWDERYKDPEFAYGKDPNLFFKKWLSAFEPGAILMPADGEGRNGVYAARQGWKVTSFDLSVEGRIKALHLAREQGVVLDYVVGNLGDLAFEKESFDAIGLIYAHFEADKKAEYHRKLHECLRPGGVVILEAFSKKHLPLVTRDPHVGGPRDIDTLYSVAEITAGFSGYETLLLAEEEIVLNEGKYHVGTGAVVRFVGRKPAPLS